MKQKPKLRWHRYGGNLWELRCWKGHIGIACTISEAESIAGRRIPKLPKTAKRRK